MTSALSAIHPSAWVHPQAACLLGQEFLGFVGAYCIVGEGVTIDENPHVYFAGAFRLRSHTVLYWGNTIGADFQTGHHVLIREQNELGSSVSVGSGSIIEHHTKIGDSVRIHSGVFIPEYTVIEADAWLGPKVTLTNARYPKAPDVKAQLMGPHIKTYAKLGANTTVLPGVTIGAHALVGAGSVVTKDVPDFAVVVGNPGRVINDVRQLAYAEQIQTLNQ